MSFLKNASIGCTISLLLYCLTGNLFDENSEAGFAFFGFLIAGSWSYLSIETSKEVSRKNEIIGFLNDYEKAVLNVVDRANFFYFAFSRFHMFCNEQKLEVNKARKIEQEGGDWKSAITSIEEKFGPGKKGILQRELIDQQNLVEHFIYIVTVKGETLKIAVPRKEEIDEVHKFCKIMLDSMKLTLEYNNIIKETPDFYFKRKHMEDILCALHEVANCRFKSFEERSCKYSAKQSWCMLIILTGIFYCLFSFFGFSLESWRE